MPLRNTVENSVAQRRTISCLDSSCHVEAIKFFIGFDIPSGNLT